MKGHKDGEGEMMWERECGDEKDEHDGEDCSRHTAGDLNPLKKGGGKGNGSKLICYKCSGVGHPAAICLTTSPTATHTCHIA